ncbi:hypothetical protein GOBAR_DD13500 [Gossypium barbadense]|nr:hypothetical protein GOBAR_DD13500 [Gossypium barbadense]
MRFNRNVLVDDMKERISAKIVRRRGRRISKRFYKFLVSTYPIKITEIELVNDEDVETIVALYYLCLVVPISYTDSQSTVHGIDIDLNVAPVFDNQNPGPRLQLHPGVFETNVDGDYGYDNSDPFNHKVYTDLDLDEVLDDIDDAGANDDGNVNEPLVGNLIRCIVIHSDHGAHMPLINPDATHAAEFLKYPDILPAHQLAVDS